MINQNTTRTEFDIRYRNIIRRYNAGGTENETYFEELMKLMEELRNESFRAAELGLSEEELEIFDLLIRGKKLTKKEEESVKLAAKNLYSKIMENRSSLLVVDWYKDEQPKFKLQTFIEDILDAILPQSSYGSDSFHEKSQLLLSHFVDMAAQGYGWIAA